MIPCFLKYLNFFSSLFYGMLMNCFMRYGYILLFLLLTVSLQGQSLFQDETEVSGSVERYLYRDYIKNTGRIFHEKRGVFPMDTVPLQEIKDNYYNRYNLSLPANVYGDKDSLCGFRKGIIVQNVMKTCPIKGAGNLRAVWFMIPLHLADVLNPDGSSNKEVYKKICKKADSKYPLPYWYNGELTLLEYPVRYWNFTVSASARFYRWHQGVPCRFSYTTREYPDYFTYKGWNLLDGYWYECINEGMRMLAASINQERIYCPKKRKKSVEFVFVLLLDGKQKCRIEVLDPRQPSEDVTDCARNLDSFFRHLRPGLFSCLYTADGRILPARYIKATYDSRGWYFEDLMQMK